MSVDLAHHDIFRAKVGKGGINTVSDLYEMMAIQLDSSYQRLCLPNVSMNH